MKKFFLIILLQLIITTLSIAEPIELKLAFEDKESFPYYMGIGMKPLKNNPGSSVEIIKLLEKKLPIHIRFIRYPWKRCLDLMAKNEVDGTFNASFKQERLKMGVYPTKNGQVDPERRLLTVYYAFYKLKGSPVDWNGKKLMNLNDGIIGVVLGYSVEKDLKNKGFPVDTANDTVSNLNKLLIQRVAVICGSKSQIDSFIKKDPERYGNVIELETPLKIKPSYLMLSKKFVSEHPEISSKIWNIIGELRDSETVQKIYDKYYRLSASQNTD